MSPKIFGRSTSAKESGHAWKCGERAAGTHSLQLRKVARPFEAAGRKLRGVEPCRHDCLERSYRVSLPRSTHRSGSRPSYARIFRASRRTTSTTLNSPSSTLLVEDTILFCRRVSNWSCRLLPWRCRCRWRPRVRNRAPAVADSELHRHESS